MDFKIPDAKAMETGWGEAIKMAASRHQNTLSRQSLQPRICADRKRSPQMRKMVGAPSYHGLPPMATDSRHLRRENQNQTTNNDSISQLTLNRTLALNL
jgi:hypothetical protein